MDPGESGEASDMKVGPQCEAYTFESCPGSYLGS